MRTICPSCKSERVDLPLAAIGKGELTLRLVDGQFLLLSDGVPVDQKMLLERGDPLAYAYCAACAHPAPSADFLEPPE